MSPSGPIPTEKFREFLSHNGWTPTSRARHGEKWNKPGFNRPVIIPSKREIYPTVMRDALRTMGLTMQDLRNWMVDG